MLTNCLAACARITITVLVSPGDAFGGLSRLHSADEDAVSWLTNYGK